MRTLRESYSQMGPTSLTWMVRRLVIALAVVGVVLGGARVAGAAEIRTDVVCGGDQQDAGVVVENVGSATPAELPPLVAPFPVPTGFEQIHDYQVAVTATADGGADFVETIVYDFGSTPDRRGTSAISAHSAVH